METILLIGWHTERNCKGVKAPLLFLGGSCLDNEELTERQKNFKDRLQEAFSVFDDHNHGQDPVEDAEPVQVEFLPNGATSTMLTEMGKGENKEPEYVSFKEWPKTIKYDFGPVYTPGDKNIWLGEGKVSHINGVPPLVNGEELKVGEGCRLEGDQLVIDTRYVEAKDSELIIGEQEECNLPKGDEEVFSAGEYYQEKDDDDDIVEVTNGLVKQIALKNNIPDGFVETDLFLEWRSKLPSSHSNAFVVEIAKNGWENPCKEAGYNCSYDSNNLKEKVETIISDAKKGSEEYMAKFNKKAKAKEPWETCKRIQNMESSGSEYLYCVEHEEFLKNWKEDPLGVMYKPGLRSFIVKACGELPVEKITYIIMKIYDHFEWAERNLFKCIAEEYFDQVCENIVPDFLLHTVLFLYLKRVGECSDGEEAEKLIKELTAEQMNCVNWDACSNDLEITKAVCENIASGKVGFRFTEAEVRDRLREICLETHVKDILSRYDGKLEENCKEEEVSEDLKEVVQESEEAEGFTDPIREPDEAVKVGIDTRISDTQACKEQEEIRRLIAASQEAGKNQNIAPLPPVRKNDIRKIMMDNDGVINPVIPKKPLTLESLEKLRDDILLFGREELSEIIALMDEDTVEKQKSMCITGDKIIKNQEIFDYLRKTGKREEVDKFLTEENKKDNIRNVIWQKQALFAMDSHLHKEKKLVFSHPDVPEEKEGEEHKPIGLAEIGALASIGLPVSPRNFSIQYVPGPTMANMDGITKASFNDEPIRDKDNGQIKADYDLVKEKSHMHVDRQTLFEAISGAMDDVETPPFSEKLSELDKARMILGVKTYNGSSVNDLIIEEVITQFLADKDRFSTIERIPADTIALYRAAKAEVDKKAFSTADTERKSREEKKFEYLVEHFDGDFIADVILPNISNDEKKILLSIVMENHKDIHGFLHNYFSLV